METLNLNVNVENLTDEERNTLMKLIKKSQEKKSKIWKPSELYWAVNGSVFHDNWMNSDIDNTRYESGNCFKTQEEAEEELTRRKMLTKWKRLSIEAGEDENKWEYNDDVVWNEHWYAYYNNCSKTIEVHYNDMYNTGAVYFPSWDSISSAITELGEDNVKKYILEVKD